MELIANDFSRQVQGKDDRPPETYGRFKHVSMMESVTIEGEQETIGTIHYKEAKNLSELLKSFAETKQRVLDIFENRINAINDYLSGRDFNLDEHTSNTLLAQMSGEYVNATEEWENVRTSIEKR